MIGRNMEMDEIRRIQSILQQQAPPEADKTTKGEGPSFSETLEKFVQDVNALQKDADEATQRLISGEAKNIHEVMLAMEEANTSFQLMMEMRNKILEAYREVMRMQV
ncbi:MAG TPA: flagellar hook-basal body complex protein FliE [Bacteroidetes bacterium]|nr:flagellar hook-basal body complex protein FliE [Bacteroidota bacterium]